MRFLCVLRPGRSLIGQKRKRFIDFNSLYRREGSWGVGQKFFAESRTQRPWSRTLTVIRPSRNIKCQPSPCLTVFILPLGQPCSVFREHWLDNIKEWTRMDSPTLIWRAEDQAGWRRLAAESSLMSLLRSARLGERVSEGVSDIWNWFFSILN